MVNKKRFERIPVELTAEIVSKDIRYEGIIENISDKGLCMRIIPSKKIKDVSPGIKLDLKLNLPSGETLNLYCKKIWSYKITPRSLIKRIGVEIIEPSLQYNKFLTTLR